jgi:homogentisate 1,2-dioxygenase
VESFAPFYTPKDIKRIRTTFRALQRDFILPNELETHDEKGDFLIKIKKEGMMHEVVYATHPFDVGWDGYSIRF